MVSKTSTWPSNVIKMWTKQPYAHTSLALDIELNEMYSFARKKVRNPFDCGFIDFESVPYTSYDFEKSRAKAVQRHVYRRLFQRSFLLCFLFAHHLYNTILCSGRLSPSSPIVFSKYLLISALCSLTLLSGSNSTGSPTRKVFRLSLQYTG